MSHQLNKTVLSTRKKQTFCEVSYTSSPVTAISKPLICVCVHVYLRRSHKGALQAVTRQTTEKAPMLKSLLERLGCHGYFLLIKDILY